MVCCRYDSLGRLGHCAPRVVVVGTVHTFLPLAGSLEKAPAAVTALEPQMESGRALSHTTVIFKAFRIAIHRCIHPVLLFCFVLIHDGIIQCGPKRLGSTPFQLGAVCFDRSSLNERFQNKAAYPGGKLRAVSTTSIRGLCTNCPLKAINGS